MDDVPYITRRNRTTVPMIGDLFRRNSHGEGSNMQGLPKNQDYREDCQTVINGRLMIYFINACACMKYQSIEYLRGACN
jgi:hypothetical protein